MESLKMEEPKGRIKTSLEIALEKVKDLKVDDESLRQLDLKKKAQLMVGSFLKGEAELAASFANVDDKDKAAVRHEVEESLLQNIVLPKSQESLEQLGRYFQGMSAIKSYSIASLEAKVRSLMEQYLAQKADITERLKQQFAASLGQLEERMGSRLRAGLENNPEFAKQKAELMRRFNVQYDAALERLKDEIRKSQ